MQEPFWRDLAVNVLANVVAAIILTLLVVVLLVLVRRRGMRRFFGLQPGRQRVMIYLSSIAVEPRGTVGTGSLSEGFHGDAITELEYRCALELAESIRSGVASRLVTALVGSRGTTEAVTAPVERSPSFRAMDRDGNKDVQPKWNVKDQLTSAASSVVLVGGPIYNVLTDQLLKQRARTGATPRFEFLRYTADDGSRVRGIRSYIDGQPEDFLRREEPDSVVDYFIVEKMRIGTTTVFVCAGTCTAATAAAVRKLQPWRRWARAYGGDPFGRIYKVTLPTGAESAGSSALARETFAMSGAPEFQDGYPNIEPVDEAERR